ncbi:DUF4332 domain-containing protein [Novipirellula artificiosorum]|uniref:DUF4332 domain-containing protein n=1 Tax=Novipirellula artificiosorum TaxID=2528016 RepID=A0A5C6DYC0_9BACT|nr:DUF4332 domain-containing protein [Novipirellula artificiosorum]TWU40827.1 hypothetical protein Poly41_16620 [Novipirellula artificiosorum]
MLLERIDIDAHGSLYRVELGPFAEHLNVVCGPEGSGKTAIARFIRDSLADRDYPLGMMSSSSGRVVWADRNGLVHCRREQDGTAHGRRSVKFESRGTTADEIGALNHCWIGTLDTQTAASRAADSIQLPESIIDGVITDTSITNVARVVSACIRSGLDAPETYRSVSMDGSGRYFVRDGYTDDPQQLDDGEHRTRRRQLAEVESELARIEPGLPRHASLVARRDEVTRRLATYRHPRRGPVETYTSDVDRTRLQQLHERAMQLRSREGELRRWIADLDSQLRSASTTPSYRSRSTGAAESYRYEGAVQDEKLRRQLDDLDAQMIRWRRALLEVRGLREAILAMHDRGVASATDAYPFTESPIDSSRWRRHDLDGFLHAIDRHDPSRGWKDFYSDRVYHTDLESRVDSATRQIDWLLQRYAVAGDLNHDWYHALPQSDAFGNTTLEETLRAIRSDLRQASQFVRNRQTVASKSTEELRELSRSEQWLVAAMDQLMRHRESLLGHYTPAERNQTRDWASHQQWLRERYGNERAERVSELHQTTAELEACFAEATRVRRAMRQLPVVETVSVPYGHENVDRETLTAELHGIEQKLAQLSRVQWLRSRASQLREQLRTVRTPRYTGSPVSDAASSWLVRLSGGRLRRVDWPDAPLRSPHTEMTSVRLVTIDGRDENQCPAADRALAVIAVRMAAGELLARLGKTLPLVIETARELTGCDADHGNRPLRESSVDSAFFHPCQDGRFNHPIASALRDYAQSGRQVLLLTSDTVLADQTARVGGRSFTLHPERIVHPHRPLWRPQYTPESYVGPHPHLYGDEVVGESPRYARSRRDVAVDVNRDFDMAWREAYGMYDPCDVPRHEVPEHRTDRAARPTSTRPVNASHYRDGHYYADAYTTSPTSAEGESVVRSAQDHGPARPFVAGGELCRVQRAETAEPAFFLTVDSPIDQAPSIDSVAAARLRGLSVTHVTHLMQQDPNRLADALGLANVDAKTIRRWQSECRLVCRVPKLRGFDARVLVGCGVTDPAQLASTHPTDLLQSVEDFLATEQGQKVLLSGSSRELSRITSWIAAANSWGIENSSRYVDGRTLRRRARVGRNLDNAFDRDRYDYDADGGSVRYGIRGVVDERDDRPRRRSTGRNGSVVEGGVGVRKQRGSTSRSSSGSGSGLGSGNGSGSGSGSGSGNGSGSGSGRSRRRRSSRTNRSINRTRRDRDVVRMNDEASERDHQTERDHHDRSARDRSARDRSARDRSARDRRSYERSERTAQPARDSEGELRFYLQRDSPVVDAPSIGPRMAERLHVLGIYTVDDLVKANAESVAAKLKNRRIDGATVLAWQQQATLVCRIPMLRGHDAQLLVAAEVTTAEDVAAENAGDLFRRIDPISRSREGRRIVRGGKLPDLEEITEWIAYAQQHRELKAA